MNEISAGVTPLTVSYAAAAQMLDISIGTLRHMIRTGMLPVVIVHKREKVAIADLRNYVEHARVVRPQPGGDAA